MPFWVTCQLKSSLGWIERALEMSEPLRFPGPGDRGSPGWCRFDDAVAGAVGTREVAIHKKLV